MRRLLVFLGVAWVAANLAGAWVSVDHERPYDLSFLDAPGAVGRIGDDWLHGWGTGLAMPLGVLAAATVLTVVVSFGGTATKVGGFLMAALGAASLGFSLTNQLTFDRLRATGGDSTETAIIAATLVLAGLLVLIGFLTVITTPATRRH